MSVCLRGRIYLRRWGRRLRGIVRDVQADFLYGHIWEPTKRHSLLVKRHYRCRLCKAVTFNRQRGHKARCPERKATRVKVVA
jgi:hypothetical protein